MEHIGQFQEGLVHGHIHNFDNMTYIHGHIHHNASHNHTDNNTTFQQQQPQQEHDTVKNENNTTNSWRDPELDFTDCEHFEFMDINNNMFPTNFGSMIGNSFHGDGSMDMNRINASDIHLYDNNNNTSNNSGRRKSKDHRLSLSDDMLNFPVSKKRRTSSGNNTAVNSNNNKDNCPCNPKLVEVCCDVDHKDIPQDDSQVENISLNSKKSFNLSGDNDMQNLSSYAMIPTPVNNITNENNSSSPLRAFKKGSNQMSVDFAKQFLNLNCDLTCEPECSEPATIKEDPLTTNTNIEGKDDILETFYKACQRVGEYNETDATPQPQQNTHTNCNHTHDPSMATTRPQYHKHTSSKQLDMQIISDICAISSLYETPLADHMNHHHHKHDEEPLPSDQPIPRSESFNLLESVVNYKGNRNSRRVVDQTTDTTTAATKLHNHHHHKIQFHDHNTTTFEPYQDDKSVSWERFKRDYKGSSNKFERKNNAMNANNNEPMTLYHHTERGGTDTAMKPEPLNTINFNWNFKTNDSSNGEKIRCRWGNCTKEYDSLIELQRHLFNEHITEYNLPINHSNSSDPIVQDTNSISPVNCKWESCEFKSNDVCSFVNHVNSRHGINFDMEFIDSRDTNSNINGKFNGMKNSHHMYHCKNNDCQSGTTPESSINKESITSIDFTDSPSFSETHIIKKEEHSPQISMASEHKIGKTIQCKWDGCTEVFSSESELDHHLESFHIPRGQSSYQCHWSGCGRTLPTRQKMVRHIRKHSGDKPFKCSECLKCFATKESLKQHGRIHSGERPFKCPYCDKSFASSAFVNVHVRTHTGEKPLKCPHCPKRFSESSNLNKHIKTHLKKQLQQGQQIPNTSTNVLV